MDDAMKAALLERAKRERARRDPGLRGQISQNVQQRAQQALTPLPEGIQAGIDQSFAPTRAAGIAGEAFDGATFGAGDEIMAGTAALLDQSGGTLRNRYDRNLAQVRRSQDQFQEENPLTAAGARIAGAVVNPATRLAAPINTVRGGAAIGGAFAAGDAFGDAEGGFTERLTEGAKAAPIGFLTAGLASFVTKGMSSGARRVFQRAEERPSIEILRAAKNVAYAAVRKSGVKFSSNDMMALSNRVARLSRTARWDIDPDLDDGAVRVLRTLQRRSDKPLTLNNLDKVRQRLWDIYKRTDEPFILEAIGEIDNTISRKADGNRLIRAAREANSRYMKAELLDNAFRKARLQTASTGSGGNILNKYRQAVTRIVTNPNEARWFSADELAVMESFIEGDAAENTLRRVGKLAPGGNGLMTALNVYAAAIDPTMLAVTAAGSAAKEGADRSAMKGSERILDAVSTGIVRPVAPAARVGAPAAVSGVGANETRR